MNVRIHNRIGPSLLLLLSLGSIGVAGQKIFVGAPTPTKKTSIDEADHRVWNHLLKKYVDDDGLVDYRAWKASSDDLLLLESYLTKLSFANPKLKAGKEAKLAFWINSYNALTVHGMLLEYPTSSIRNHTAKLFGYNIWKDLQLYVGGRPFSLDDIEHKILRKMDEPRIHFAVVCASTSCPRLLNEAYTADSVEEQLELNAKDFFSRPGNFRFQGNRMGLSSILKWYGDDFGSNTQDQLKAISAWLPTQEASQAAANNTARIQYLEYDWSINEQPEKRSK